MIFLIKRGHSGNIMNTQNQDKKFFNFFVVACKNENEDTKKYCIKAKIKKNDVYLITYCKKGDK